MSSHRRARDALSPTSNRLSAKTFRDGFGIVRFLTHASEKEVTELLDDPANPDIIAEQLRPVDARLHVTVIGFMGMHRHVQAAFNAGFSVARLEETIEGETREASPRKPFSATFGEVEHAGKLIYSKIEDARLTHEQVQIAGQVALRGVSPKVIRRQIIPPHMSLGYAPDNETARELATAIEGVLYEQPVALQRWSVYSGRYD